MWRLWPWLCKPDAMAWSRGRTLASLAMPGSGQGSVLGRLLPGKRLVVVHGQLVDKQGQGGNKGSEAPLDVLQQIKAADSLDSLAAVLAALTSPPAPATGPTATASHSDAAHQQLLPVHDVMNAALQQLAHHAGGTGEPQADAAAAISSSVAGQATAPASMAAAGEAPGRREQQVQPQVQPRALDVLGVLETLWLRAHSVPLHPASELPLGAAQVSPAGALSAEGTHGHAGETGPSAASESDDTAGSSAVTTSRSPFWSVGNAGGALAALAAVRTHSSSALLQAAVACVASPQWAHAPPQVVCGQQVALACEAAAGLDHLHSHTALWHSLGVAGLRAAEDGRLDPQQLVRVLRAHGAARKKCAAILRVAGTRLAAEPGTFSLEDVEQMVWTAARTRARPRQLLRAACTKAAAYPSLITPPLARSLLLLLTSIRVHHGPLAHTLLSVLEPHVRAGGGLGPGQLTELVRCAGLQGARHAGFLDAAGDALVAEHGQHGTLPLRAVTHAMWAYAHLSHPHAQLVEVLGRAAAPHLARLVTSEGGPGMLASLGAALTWLQHPGDDHGVGSAYSRAALVALDGTQSLSLPEAAWLARAAAGLSQTSQRSTAHPGSTSSVHSTTQRVLERAADRVLANSEHLDLDTCSHMAAAFAVAGMWGTPRGLQLAARLAADADTALSGGTESSARQPTSAAALAQLSAPAASRYDPPAPTVLGLTRAALPAQVNPEANGPVAMKQLPQGSWRTAEGPASLSDDGSDMGNASSSPTPGSIPEQVPGAGSVLGPLADLAHGMVSAPEAVRSPRLFESIARAAVGALQAAQPVTHQLHGAVPSSQDGGCMPAVYEGPRHMISPLITGSGLEPWAQGQGRATEQCGTITRLQVAWLPQLSGALAASGIQRYCGGLVAQAAGNALATVATATSDLLGSQPLQHVAAATCALGAHLGSRAALRTQVLAHTVGANGMGAVPDLLAVYAQHGGRDPVVMQLGLRRLQEAAVTQRQARAEAQQTRRHGTRNGQLQGAGAAPGQDLESSSTSMSGQAPAAPAAGDPVIVPNSELLSLAGSLAALAPCPPSTPSTLTTLCVARASPRQDHVTQPTKYTQRRPGASKSVAQPQPQPQSQLQTNSAVAPLGPHNQTCLAPSQLICALAALSRLGDRRAVARVLFSSESTLVHALHQRQLQGSDVELLARVLQESDLAYATHLMGPLMRAANNMKDVDGSRARGVRVASAIAPLRMASLAARMPHGRHAQHAAHDAVAMRLTASTVAAADALLQPLASTGASSHPAVPADITWTTTHVAAPGLVSLAQLVPLYVALAALHTPQVLRSARSAAAKSSMSHKVVDGMGISGSWHGDEDGEGMGTSGLAVMHESGLTHPPRSVLIGAVHDMMSQPAGASSGTEDSTGTESQAVISAWASHLLSRTTDHLVHMLGRSSPPAAAPAAAASSLIERHGNGPGEEGGDDAGIVWALRNSLLRSSTSRSPAMHVAMQHAGAEDLSIVLRNPGAVAAAPGSTEATAQDPGASTRIHALCSILGAAASSPTLLQLPPQLASSTAQLLSTAASQLSAALSAQEGTAASVETIQHMARAFVASCTYAHAPGPGPANLAVQPRAGLQMAARAAQEALASALGGQAQATPWRAADSQQPHAGYSTSEPGTVSGLRALPTDVLLDVMRGCTRAAVHHAPLTAALQLELATRLHPSHLALIGGPSCNVPDLQTDGALGHGWVLAQGGVDSSSAGSRGGDSGKGMMSAGGVASVIQALEPGHWRWLYVDEVVEAGGLMLAMRSGARTATVMRVAQAVVKQGGSLWLHSAATSAAGPSKLPDPWLPNEVERRVEVGDVVGAEAVERWVAAVMAVTGDAPPGSERASQLAHLTGGALLGAQAGQRSAGSAHAQARARHEQLWAAMQKPSRPQSTWNPRIPAALEHHCSTRSMGANSALRAWTSLLALGWQDSVHAARMVGLMLPWAEHHAFAADIAAASLPVVCEAAEVAHIRTARKRQAPAAWVAERDSWHKLIAELSSSVWVAADTVSQQALYEVRDAVGHVLAAHRAYSSQTHTRAGQELVRAHKRAEAAAYASAVLSQLRALASEDGTGRGGELVGSSMGSSSSSAMIKGNDVLKGMHDCLFDCPPALLAAVLSAAAVAPPGALLALRGLSRSDGWQERQVSRVRALLDAAMRVDALHPDQGPAVRAVSQLVGAWSQMHHQAHTASASGVCAVTGPADTTVVAAGATGHRAPSKLQSCPSPRATSSFTVLQPAIHERLEALVVSKAQQVARLAGRAAQQQQVAGHNDEALSRPQRAAGSSRAAQQPTSPAAAGTEAGGTGARASMQAQLGGSPHDVVHLACAAHVLGLRSAGQLAAAAVRLSKAAPGTFSDEEAARLSCAIQSFDDASGSACVRGNGSVLKARDAHNTTNKTTTTGV